MHGRRKVLRRHKTIRFWINPELVAWQGASRLHQAMLEMSCLGTQRARIVGVVIQPTRGKGHKFTAAEVPKGPSRKPSHTCAHTPVCSRTRIHHFSLMTRSRSPFSLANTHPTRTHTGFSRCRLTLRSTWGVTVEREGHWEMLWATCRASSLRAASTSSSLATSEAKYQR